MFTGLIAWFLAFAFDDFCDPACQKMILCAGGVVTNVSWIMAFIRASPSGEFVSDAKDSLKSVSVALYGMHSYISAMTLPANPTGLNPDEEASYWANGIYGQIQAFLSHRASVSGEGRDEVIAMLDGMEDETKAVVTLLNNYNPS